MPDAGGTTRPNPLPAVERWKLFDNLRRSLVPPALVLLLVLGWTVLPGSPWLWTAAALAVVGLAAAAATGEHPVPHGRVPWPGGLKGNPIPSGLGNTAGQVLLSTAFLADQARLLLDAIGRTLVRLFVTRRKLLEWETAASTEQRLGTGLLHFSAMMWPAPALAVVLAAVLAFAAPATPCPRRPRSWSPGSSRRCVAFWVSRPPRRRRRRR